jgi:DNA polymerase-3 subunit epsilon
MFFRSPPWDSAVYWALDLETGGLDVKKDPILSVGMVPLRGGRIRLRECYRTFVRPEPGSTITPGSVEAHQLVWSEVETAPLLANSLPDIDRRIREGVLLVHHAGIDVSFLKRAYRRLGLRWPSPPVVDTMRLLVRAAEVGRPGTPRDTLALNLSRARAEYGLPEYGAHDALGDAIATAELFLAVRLALGARTLRDLR